ncbi:MAG: protein glxC [Rhodovibrionaceae bacterium]|nr:protein glxC [Rhodovibrionaceae bacterium]
MVASVSDTRENVVTLDLSEESLRSVNERLSERNGTDDGGHYRVLNPRGAHALACGLNAPVSVEIAGNTGYYCAGMNKSAEVTVDGNVGVGCAENMMSGRVHVHGDASQSAGASAHGGLLVIDGNASARCGISLKGGDIVVKGSVGHMSMFMAQAGRLVVLGDAGDSLGDSIYEARIYVRGKVGTLGADCVEKEMRDEHREELRALLDSAGCGDVDVKEFRRYGSARQLYHFKVENISAY